MRLHREGYPTLAFLAGVLFLLNLLFGRFPAPVRRGLALASAVVFGLFAQFFRNPDRTTPDRTDCIVAPADGTIVAVERVREKEYFDDERLKISIYMSALNVHLNRVPISGTVVYRRYHPGKYLVAFHPKASELNERNTIVIETPDGQTLLVRQIAGIMARRITSYPQVGDTVRAGDELGFIKLGSRCDVFLPVDCPVHVRLQDKVKGGETILAIWKPG
ncbi:MAG: phosphatidylserine decarboxylase family protein [Anaerolineae bacterium]|nr:phosphatidylserine decarboxylase family protein [Anaerolineae bacterium]